MKRVSNLTIKVSAETKQALQAIQDQLGAASLTETIRRMAGLCQQLQSPLHMKDPKTGETKTHLW
jgi:hypothetical protein